MDSQQLEKLVAASKTFINICVVCLLLLGIYKVAISYWSDPPVRPEPRFKNTLQRDINP